MKNSLALAVLLALQPSVSSACHRVYPSGDSVGGYKAVFLGEVTGVHLVGYENRIIGKPDAFVVAQSDSLKPVIITDGSASVDVFAVPLKVASGQVEQKQFRLVGCTAPLPQLKERRIFFVQADGTAIAIWESDYERFDAWLAKLAIDIN